MKKLTIFILMASALFAEDNAKPLASQADLQAEYTKALIDLANAQSARLDLNEQVKKALADSDEALKKGQAAVQAALQKKATDCAGQGVDFEVLNGKGLLTCTANKK